MVRMNITVPDDVGKELGRIKNKSRFIAQTLRERFMLKRRKATESLLEKSYKKVAQEDGLLVREWDSVASDGINE